MTMPAVTCVVNVASVYSFPSVTALGMVEIVSLLTFPSGSAALSVTGIEAASSLPVALAGLAVGTVADAEILMVVRAEEIGRAHV